MSTAAYELARYLEAAGVGTFGGGTEWSLHVSREPESPDNVITLYDTAGLPPIQGEGVDLRMPQVQVRVRSDDYLAAFEVQEQVRALLLPTPDVSTGTRVERTIGQSRYLTISPVADILAIGRDDNDRHIVVANYQVIRQSLEVPS